MPPRWTMDPMRPVGVVLEDFLGVLDALGGMCLGLSFKASASCMESPIRFGSVGFRSGLVPVRAVRFYSFKIFFWYFLRFSMFLGVFYMEKTILKFS